MNGDIIIVPEYLVDQLISGKIDQSTNKKDREFILEARKYYKKFSYKNGDGQVIASPRVTEKGVIQTTYLDGKTTINLIK